VVDECKEHMANVKAFGGRIDPTTVENVIITIIPAGEAQTPPVGKGGRPGKTKGVKVKLSELAHVAPKGKDFILTVNDDEV